MKKYLYTLGTITLIAIGVIIYVNVLKKSDDVIILPTDVEVDYDQDKDDIDFSTVSSSSIDLSEYSGKVVLEESGVYTFTNTLNGYLYINNTNDKNIKIILNNVTITNDNGPCIYVQSVKNLYLELVGTNTLTDGTTYVNFDEDVNGAIYSKDDLIIDGDGTLIVKANYADGIVSKDNLTIKNSNITVTSLDDGIRGKDSLVIQNGNITIKAGGDGLKSTNDTDTEKGYILIENGQIDIDSTLDGIQAESKVVIENGTINIKSGNGSSITSQNNNWGHWNSSTKTESAKGIKAGNSIGITKAIITINSSDDAIHSNEDIVINSGTFNLSSGDDGIHADSSITINNGTINITQSYEGIESNVILIKDGNIKVYASDDGINISGGNDNSSMGGRPGQNNFEETNDSTVYLQIDSGTIYVNAGGDGLDSNGSIYMNGGTVYVDGPTDNGNGPLDYNNTFVITGGTLIAAGSSGMAQNISSSSSQYGVLINFSSTQSANTKVSIEGIIDYTPSKNFSSIVISTPNFKKNTTYNILLNNTKYTSFTMNSIATSVGTSSNMNRR